MWSQQIRPQQPTPTTRPRRHPLVAAVVEVSHNTSVRDQRWVGKALGESILFVCRICLCISLLIPFLSIYHKSHTFLPSHLSTCLLIYLPISSPIFLSPRVHVSRVSLHRSLRRSSRGVFLRNSSRRCATTMTIPIAIAIAIPIAIVITTHNDLRVSDNHTI